jgi:hypothetical protein
VSYSRWPESRWYTYWNSSEDNFMQTSEFRVEHFSNPFTFTYREIKEDRRRCADLVAMFFGICDGEVTDDELLELEMYMDSFIKDVEKEFEHEV